jgi:ferric-dicitrate binding protein FerR (iron transport regulator)
MTDASQVEIPVEIFFDFQDASASDDQQETTTQNLYQQLRKLDDIEVERVADPNPPEGNRGAAFLWGLLQAKVSYDSVKAMFGFMGDRLGNKPIKVKVKRADGQEIELEASSRVELDWARCDWERPSSTTSRGSIDCPYRPGWELDRYG